VITSPSGGTRVPTQDLVPVALRGLAASGLTPDGEMPFTLRGAPGPDGPEVRPEGHSLRYSAIAALTSPRARSSRSTALSWTRRPCAGAQRWVRAW